MALLKDGHPFSLFTIQMDSVLDSKKKGVENELVAGAVRLLVYSDELYLIMTTTRLDCQREV